ncbi:MAG: glycosyl hydrolase family 28 protein, partial [Bacteroidota bacterium]
MSFFVLIIALFSACNTQNIDVTIQAFGAVGDSTTINTASIQQAVDYVNKRGGGRVTITDGAYVTGPIILRSDVEIHIDADAVVLGSLNQDDYPDSLNLFKDSLGQLFGVALFWGSDVRNVTISGKGTINGRGTPEFFNRKNPDHVRPSLIRIKDSENIVVKDVTLTNAASWVQHYIDSDSIWIDGIT